MEVEIIFKERTRPKQKPDLDSVTALDQFYALRLPYTSAQLKAAEAP